jgi:hypothetical protein
MHLFSCTFVQTELAVLICDKEFRIAITRHIHQPDTARDRVDRRHGIVPSIQPNLHTINRQQMPFNANEK